MIEFVIETVGPTEHGPAYIDTIDVALRNLIEITWGLAAIGAEKPTITVLDFQTAKVSFQTNEGAVAFKLICDRKIF